MNETAEALTEPVSSEYELQCRADGKRTIEIADALRIHPVSVSVIVRSYSQRGVEGRSRQPNHKPGKPPFSHTEVPPAGSPNSRLHHPLPSAVESSISVISGPSPR